MLALRASPCFVVICVSLRRKGPRRFPPCYAITYDSVQSRGPDCDLTVRSILTGRAERAVTAFEPFLSQPPPEVPPQTWGNGCCVYDFYGCVICGPACLPWACLLPMRAPACAHVRVFRRLSSFIVARARTRARAKVVRRDPAVASRVLHPASYSILKVGSLLAGYVQLERPR